MAMNYQQRHVPLDYTGLLNAVHGGEFPAERHWLDFKRELYPRPPANGMPAKAKSKKEVHEELARDLASLAVRGGYLVFGVEEDKASHTFTVVDMPLPAHLDQTVDQVARDFIDPPLLVVPTLLTDQGNPGHGMMVVEVAESPDAPHMVGGIYYGRSETGKVKLTDAEVERLILLRGRADQRLQTAMADTLTADPEPGTQEGHFYFTAVPTQGRPDILLGYTRDTRAHSSFMSTATNWRNAIARADGSQRGNPAKPIAFEQMAEARRGQKPRGAWFYNYPRDPPALRLGTVRRTLGLDDDGTVRFIDMAAGSLPDGLHPAVAERMRMG
ncbi:MAG: AlbA family DNA-binding domain-containing protein, partial [Streptosporangiaceae bacterium]